MFNIIFERFILPKIPTEKREIANLIYDLMSWTVFLALIAFCIYRFKPEFYEIYKITDFYLIFFVFTVGVLFTLWFQAFIPSQKFEVKQTDVILRRSIMMFQALVFGIVVLAIFNPYGLFYQIAKNYAQDTIGIPREWVFSGQTDAGVAFSYSNGTLFLSNDKKIDMKFVQLVRTNATPLGVANESINWSAFIYNQSIEAYPEVFSGLRNSTK